MTIPLYRHNVEYDDWEVASVYDSDDCDDLSEDDESLRPSYFYQHPLTHPRRDGRRLPAGRLSPPPAPIVPPPGVIFPCSPPQSHWHADPVESSLLLAPSRRPHATSVMVPGKVPNVGSPPRYRDVVGPTSPHPAEARYQAHPGMATSPRRPAHDVGHATQETAGRVAGSHPSHREEEYDVNGGRRKARQARERRPSVWQRFVGRFSSSRGQ